MNWALGLGIMILFSATSFLAYSFQDENILERAPVLTFQIQNAQGEQKNNVVVNEQILIVADISNYQTIQQPFAYIVQIQDDSGVVVSLGWLLGALEPNQILSPALSWTPDSPGIFTATVFVWEAIDNPEPLSHTLSIDIDVGYEED